MPMKPPGSAKALMLVSRTVKKVSLCSPSCASTPMREPRCLQVVGRSPDHPAAGSGRAGRAPSCGRSGIRPARLTSALAPLPRSGRRRRPALRRGRPQRILADGRGRCHRQVRPARAAGQAPDKAAVAVRHGRSDRAGCTKVSPGPRSSEDIRRLVGQPRALAPLERDVPRMGPAAEAVDHVGEAGGGLGEVGRVDLRDVAQADHLGARAGAGDAAPSSAWA